MYRIGIVPQSYRFQREDPAGYTTVMPLMNEQLEESFLPGQVAESSDIRNEQRRPKFIVVTEWP